MGEDKSKICPTCGAGPNEPCEHVAKQETLEGKNKKEATEDVWARLDIIQLRHAAKDMDKTLGFRDVEITALQKNIDQLKQQLMMQNVAVQKIVKEDQDSIEIGAQATGRVKVYGSFGKKQEFAARIKDAVELLEATRATLEKMNGSGEGDDKK